MWKVWMIFILHGYIIQFTQIPNDLEECYVRAPKIYKQLHDFDPQIFNPTNFEIMCVRQPEQPMCDHPDLTLNCEKKR